MVKQRARAHSRRKVESANNGPEEDSDFDFGLEEFKPLLGAIRHPRAFVLLYTLIGKHEEVFMFTDPDSVYKYTYTYSPRRVLFTLTDFLISTPSNHRNLAVLSQAGLVVPILEWHLGCEGLGESNTSTSGSDIHEGEDNTTKPPRTRQTSKSKPEKQTLQKLIKRLLELGAPESTTRELFRRTVAVTRIDVDPDPPTPGEAETTNHSKLDAEVLDLVKAGVKGSMRWPGHFVFCAGAGLGVGGDSVGGKGWMSAGFTFMVRGFSFFLPVFCVDENGRVFFCGGV